MRNWTPWIPGGLLSIGCLFTLFINRQQDMPLAAPLSTLPGEVAGYPGTERPITEEEQRVAGMTNYSFRTIARDSTIAFTSTSATTITDPGQDIHSPKNCLPGSGWEALAQSEKTVTTPGPARKRSNVTCCRTEEQRALVLYGTWGRGRVAPTNTR
jgi:hypothetical protein